MKLTVNQGPNLPSGWQTVTISKAEEGDHQGTKWIDLYFEGLPDTVNCRLWSKVNETTGEDFGIGNLFYYANAGLTIVEEGSVEIDADVSHLAGKQLNVLFYLNANGYTDVAQRVAPVPGDNFSEGYVEKLKAKAQAWVDGKTKKTETADAPF